MESGAIRISQKEATRFDVLRRVLDGTIGLMEAAVHVGVSYRHAKRLKAKTEVGEAPPSVPDQWIGAPAETEPVRVPEAPVEVFDSGTTERETEEMREVELSIAAEGVVETTAEETTTAQVPTPVLDELDLDERLEQLFRHQEAADEAKAQPDAGASRDAHKRRWFSRLFGLGRKATKSTSQTLREDEPKSEQEPPG